MKWRRVFLAFIFAVTQGCALLEIPGEPAVVYKSPSQLYEKALGYYQAGKYAKASALFHEYIGTYPDTPLVKVAVYYLGYCYQELGQEKDALAFYNRVLADYGDEDFWGQQAMARIRQIKGDAR